MICWVTFWIIKPFLLNFKRIKMRKKQIKSSHVIIFQSLRTSPLLKLQHLQLYPRRWSFEQDEAWTSAEEALSSERSWRGEGTLEGFSSDLKLQSAWAFRWFFLIKGSSEKAADAAEMWRRLEEEEERRRAEHREETSSLRTDQNCTTKKPKHICTNVQNQQD